MYQPTAVVNVICEIKVSNYAKIKLNKILNNELY